jgi:hypothetical protein
VLLNSRIVAVVNSRLGRGVHQSVWAWWSKVVLGVVVNSGIGRFGKKSDWTWW